MRKRQFAELMLALALGLASVGFAESPASADVGGNISCGAHNGGWGPISRYQVIERARSWLAARVSYSQTACYGNEYGAYRQDCSGFAAMAWGLPGGADAWYTGNIRNVTVDIARSDLRMGDALWRRAGNQGHMGIFVGWADLAHTQPIVYEEFDFGRVAERRVWPASYASTFTPIRYNGIKSHVFSGGTGHLFRVQPNGTLQYAYHYGWNDGRSDWAGNIASIGSGWDRYMMVFAMDTTVYGVDEFGILYWFRWTGSGWVGCGCGVNVGTGWNAFKKVISGQDGIVYGVGFDGVMRWYRHFGWVSGANNWSGNSGKVLGQGWAPFAHVTADLGQVFAVGGDGTMKQYSYSDPHGGNGTWANANGSTIGTGWWFPHVFGGGHSALYATSVVYAVGADGSLQWYGRQGGGWRPATTVGYGWL